MAEAIENNDQAMEVSQTRPRLRGAEGEDDAGEGRTGGQPGRWGGRAGRAKRRRRRATRRETTPFLPSLSTRLSAAACSAQRIGKRGLEREDEAKPATSLAAPPRFSSSSPGNKARAVRSPPPPPPSSRHPGRLLGFHGGANPDERCPRNVD